MAFAFLLVWEVLFLLETQYPRSVVVEYERQHGASEIHDGGSTLDLKRTKQLPWLVRLIRTSPKSSTADDMQNIRKIPGVAHPKPWETLITFCKLWAYPRLAVSVCGYIFLHYWWYVALTTQSTHEVGTK